MKIYQQMCMKSIEAVQSHTFIIANSKKHFSLRFSFTIRRNFQQKQKFRLVEKLQIAMKNERRKKSFNGVDDAKKENN